MGARRFEEDAMKAREAAMAALLAVGIFAAAHAPGVPLGGGMVGMAPNESEVTRVAESYAAAMNRGDAAAMAAVYAEDGVEMPPGKPAVRGRSQIEAYHRRELAGPVKLSGFALTPSETRTVGDIAYTTGTSRVTLTPPGGAPAVDSSGKYMVVFRRQGDGWKAAYAIYNTDGPCGP
jgi:uncharacterized protein (TIGR02246 family)